MTLTRVLSQGKTLWYGGLFKVQKFGNTVVHLKKIIRAKRRMENVGCQRICVTYIWRLSIIALTLQHLIYKL